MSFNDILILLALILFAVAVCSIVASVVYFVLISFKESFWLGMPVLGMFSFLGSVFLMKITK